MLSILPDGSVYLLFTFYGHSFGSGQRYGEDRGWGFHKIENNQLELQTRVNHLNDQVELLTEKLSQIEINQVNQPPQTPSKEEQI